MIRQAARGEARFASHQPSVSAHQSQGKAYDPLSSLRAEDLSKFMQWISTTHVRRWREHRQKVGEGHLYQGRFRSFPVQDDHHLLTVMRYAEANPLRAKMVEKAEAWPWSSFGGGTAGDGTKVQLGK